METRFIVYQGFSKQTWRYESIADFDNEGDAKEFLTSKEEEALNHGFQCKPTDHGFKVVNHDGAEIQRFSLGQANLDEVR